LRKALDVEQHPLGVAPKVDSVEERVAHFVAPENGRSVRSQQVIRSGTMLLVDRIFETEP